MKLTHQSYSDNCGGISLSCPNSDDERSDNGACLIYIKCIRQEFKKEKRTNKPPRLLSNDFIEREKEHSLCGNIQEESVFFSNMYEKEGQEIEDNINDDEEDADDENENEFVLTMAEQSKKYTPKAISILQVLKHHSKL